MILVDINGACAAIRKQEVLTAGRVGALVEFLFNEEWEGLAKTAVFRAGELTKDAMLNNSIAKIPHEVLIDGVPLEIGVYGTKDDGAIVIPTVWVKTNPVKEGVDPSGEEGLDPSLPFWAELQERLEKDLKGEKGDKGDKGDKGEKGDKGDKGDPGMIVHTDADGSVLDEIFLKKRPVYNAGTGNFLEIIRNAEAGAIIQLDPGTYPLLTLTNQYGLTRKNLHGYIALAYNNGVKDENGNLVKEATVTTYPENLTIRGQAGVYVEGVSLSSGVLSHERTLTDLTLSTLPGGLTFENINFTKTVALRNAQIDGLSFIGCHISNGNISIKASDYSDVYGGDHWKRATATIRSPFMSVRAKNVTIKNCTINAKGLSQSYTSAIYLSCVDGATIDANTIEGADFNGIQVAGLTTFSSTGKITISSNDIKNTASRPIRIANLENADINVIMNAFAEGAGSASDCIYISGSINTKTFFGKGGSNSADAGTLNLYDGARIDVGSGVIVSSDTVYDTIVAQSTSGLWTYRKWSSGLAELWYRGKFNYTYQYVALPFTLVEELGCFAKQMMKNDSDGETTDVTVYSPYTDGTSLYIKKQINGVVHNAAYLDTPVYIVGRWK